jgi:hypothetical protein
VLLVTVTAIWVTVTAYANAPIATPAVRERGCGERRLPSSILLVPPKSVLSVLSGRIAFEAGAVMACEHRERCSRAKHALSRSRPHFSSSSVRSSSSLAHGVRKHAVREDEEDQGINLALDRGYGLALAGIEVWFSVPGLNAEAGVDKPNMRCACRQLRGKGEGQTQGG